MIFVLRFEEMLMRVTSDDRRPRTCWREYFVRLPLLTSQYSTVEKRDC